MGAAKCAILPGVCSVLSLRTPAERQRSPRGQWCQEAADSRHDRTVCHFRLPALHEGGQRVGRRLRRRPARRHRGAGGYPARWLRPGRQAGRLAPRDRDARGGLPRPGRGAAGAPGAPRRRPAPQRQRRDAPPHRLPARRHRCHRGAGAAAHRQRARARARPRPRERQRRQRSRRRGRGWAQRGVQRGPQPGWARAGQKRG
mmetsp:Transcript_101455/g.287288  ORF Transcript_101455/g.287288 Transcript_101455/m.287288 type:complete len:201 (+) Transcript_101455:442-1044(+)